MPGACRTPSYQHLLGVPVGKFTLPECFESAAKYRPHEDDVFIVTYPKCGTTWMQHIVYLIQHHGIPPSNAKEFFSSSPYIDLLGVECVKTLSKPGAFKTHFPFHLVPYSPLTKYIVVIRNPRDVAVSFHYHLRMFPPYEYDGTFSDTFECFMKGEVDYGDYFDFYKEWYEHKKDRNVLFLTYEELKGNPKENILRVAKFLGRKYEEELLKNDKEVLKKVVKYSSVEHMKKDTNRFINDFFQVDPADVASDPNATAGLKFFHESILKASRQAGGLSINYVRKGVVGDWKNHFSQDQMQRLNQHFQEKWKGTELASLWPDMDFTIS